MLGVGAGVDILVDHVVPSLNSLALAEDVDSGRRGVNCQFCPAAQVFDGVVDRILDTLKK